jgi:hypothetical protein
MYYWSSHDIKQIATRNESFLVKILSVNILFLNESFPWRYLIIKIRVIEIKIYLNLKFQFIKWSYIIF